ncbi:MAG: putative phage abortive infection protein [Ignavibacteriae bacterium]|nr:putative phage abortive infection protein [Ignavibacteriota bacterium]
MKTFDKKFWLSLVPIIILILLAGFTPYLFTRKEILGFCFSETGQIGDTIGGIFGPMIAIIAAILTYMAFWVQYKANIQLRDDIRIDRFETKFYEMLKLHRQNLSEIELDEMTGKKAIEAMFNELYYGFMIVKECLDGTYPLETRVFDRNLTKPEYKNDEKYLDLAFNVFFFGKQYFNRDHKNYNFIFDYNREFILKLFRVFHNISENNEFRRIHFSSLEPIVPKHKLFIGQSSNLGNYFRLLYQTVKHIDEMKQENITELDKYNYVKTLRAQLSNHEQLLLYYNSLSKMGEAWIKNNYIQKYKLIKNIPLPLADFGINPEEKFKKEILSYKEKGQKFFEMQ